MLAEAVEAGGSIVVSGGSTPRRAYELAAALDGDWGGVDLWFGDDRCVPAYDPLSNQLLVRETILDRIIVHPTVHAIPTELSPDEAAAAYDAELRDEPLDLVLLGIGSDGHTASLFPDAPTLDVRDRLAVAAEPGLDPFVERVTLTIPALESGAHVVFLVVGEEKADAARRAFATRRRSRPRRASCARATARRRSFSTPLRRRSCPDGGRGCSAGTRPRGEGSRRGVPGRETPFVLHGRCLPRRRRAQDRRGDRTGKTVKAPVRTRGSAARAPTPCHSCRAPGTGSCARC